MNKIKSILFVCTGNSCRSVMAEELMRRYLKELGKDISVSSAGVSAIDGLSPTQETVNVMKDEGLDVSAHRATRITEELIKKADLILVMEESHKRIVTSMVPEAAGKTLLLKEYMVDKNKKNYPENPDVPDPIGEPTDFYKLSLEVIKDNIKRIAEKL